MKWLLIVSVIVLAAGGWWLHARITEPAAVALAVAAERGQPPATHPADPPALLLETREEAVADREVGAPALPPDDAAWVRAEVARWEAARTLTRDERVQLVAELTSIRMFAVLEREEPMSVEAP